LAADASALLALGLRSHTDIPALKELEEWFDLQKEMRGKAKLDLFLREQASSLPGGSNAKTLGEFALEEDRPH
jgi:hypothetical protein